MSIDIAHVIGETSDYDKKQQLEVNKPKNWCKSMSAFANGRGGMLVFGIADDDTVVGIADPQSRPVQDCDLMHVKSRRRNPVLADIFSRLKYMERRGSGFKKICQDYSHQTKYQEEKHPKFYSNSNDFVLTLYNLNYGVVNEENNRGSQIAPNFPKLPRTFDGFYEDIT